MSQAFVKEGDAGDDLPERPVPEGPNYVTPSGLAALQEEQRRLLEKRKTVRDPALLSPIDRDLRYLKARLDSAVLVQPPKEPPPEARFGACVTVQAGDGERCYWIVGQDEADPAQGRLSWSSPLALALMGARPGDEVAFQDRALRVLSVSY